MRVLIACEESQTVCKAFRERGHEAYSCDIEDCSGGHPEWHIKEDVLIILSSFRFYTQDHTEHFIGKWDMMIGHPPCDFLANSGVKHLYLQNFLPDKVRNNVRWESLCRAKVFFNKLKNADIPLIALENPIPHKYAVQNTNVAYGFGGCEGIGKYDQIIQPWQFGHKQMKATCLWLKGLPKLQPADIVGPPPKDTKERYKWQNCWTASPGPNRKKLRSKTFPGIAKAMAEQWG